MEQLDEEPRAVRLHRRCDAPVPLDDLREVAAEGVRGEQARRVHRRRLEHDQPDAAPRPRLVVGDEVVRRQVLVDERGLVRGRDDAVLELDRTERERAEQVLH